MVDQDVNRPGYTSQDFGSALDDFYGNHPDASGDPTQWTAQQRAQYEPEIVSAYRLNRRTVETRKLIQGNNNKGVDTSLDDLQKVDKRGNAIMDSDLNASPGTLQWPANSGCGC